MWCFVVVEVVVDKLLLLLLLLFQLQLLLVAECTLRDSGLEVRSIIGVVIKGIEDVSCWIVTYTIDSASVSAVIFSLSASEGLSLKNRLLKLRSFVRCCREDKVPKELACSFRITCSSTVSLRFSCTFGFFIIAVQTLGSGISILLAVGTPFTDSGNLYCQWELSPSSGNALCILFPTCA
nr:hypothetical protein [Tanacetum cinerariifolium]